MIKMSTSVFLVMIKMSTSVFLCPPTANYIPVNLFIAFQPSAAGC